MTVQTMGTNFPAEVVREMFTKVNGHSSIAKLAAQMPLSFTGNQVFTFSMDKEAAIVAEGGKKTEGGITVAPVKIQPIKIEYGARVTDEFLYASEEKQLDILRQFTDGYARKVARALDIMAMHGVNPRDGVASALIGTNSFDTNADVTKVTYTGTSASLEENLEDAIKSIGDYDNTGYAFSKDFASELGRLTTTAGTKLYPEFSLGGKPGTLHGVPADVNSTVSFAGGDEVILGDFANAFKWGYAKEVPFEVIPYGDPDGSGNDLKAFNQVYLRAETYIGWGILDGAAFARITA